MRRKWMSILLVVIMMSTMLTGCKTSGGEVSDTRKETLFVTGMQWNPAQNFNWFSGWPAWPTNSTANPMVYEPLFLYNSVTNELHPFLGKAYEWVGDYSLKITLHDGTAFSDGEPLNTEDIEYTFDVATRYWTSWTGYLETIDSIEIVNDRTFIIHSNEELFNHTTLLEMISRTPVLPKHIWEPFEIENAYEYGPMAEFFNDDPVGSGAYIVDFHDSQQIRTVRNEDWWGKDVHGLPSPKYITHLIYNSNDAATLDLKTGTLDYSENFISQVWHLKEHGVKTYLAQAPYYNEETIPSLYINQHRPGLELVDVRRALAHAFDYPDITEKAMDGYSSVIEPSLMIFDYEKALIDHSQIRDLQWSYNPEKAIDILEGIGAMPGADGIRVLPDGTRLGPWQVQCPAGWSEWNATIEMAVQNARQVGIELVSSFTEWGVYDNNKSTGNFDIIMDTPAAYSTPGGALKRAYSLMFSENVAPIGEAAYWNYGRFHSDRANDIIKAIGQTSDTTELSALFTELNIIYLSNIPAIPMYYRPTYFYTFNENVWKGFPTSSDSNQLPGSLFDGAGYLGLFQLKHTK